MTLIVFGNEPPKVSFVQRPNGSVEFKISNNRVVNIPDPKPTITWGDLYEALNANRSPQLGPDWRDYKKAVKAYNVAMAQERKARDAPPPALHQAGATLGKLYTAFTAELADLTGSETERTFFSMYADLWASFYNPFECAALIPQVWVNWIHYDRADAERAERARKEPFRVDFMMKFPDFGENCVIIEIDGPSHFGEPLIGDNGRITLKPTMEAYTEHLRKDRWLRRQGWMVYRISSLEIDRCKDFESLSDDVFGINLTIPYL